MAVVPGRAGRDPVPGRAPAPPPDRGGVAVRVGRARHAEFEGLAAAGWDVVTESPFDRLRTTLRGWLR